MKTSLEGRLLLDRRQFVQTAALWLGSVALPARVYGAADESAWSLSAEARSALETSPLVYVSPLLADGSESRCHGEVWFFVDQGDVVIGAGANGWKARALVRGLDRARLWVGDFGRASGKEGPFRQAPSFLARARRDSDPAVFERLFEQYGRRYADEWGKWGPRFRQGYADGSRILIRYTPIGA